MSRSLSSRAFIVALASLGLLLAGCGSSGSSYGSPAASTVPSASSPSSGPAPSAGSAVLTISGFMFSPLTVQAGQTVTVKNKDSAAHTATSSAGGFGVTVPGNGQATFTAPSKPGTYPLTCDFHPDMVGSLTVTA